MAVHGQAPLLGKLEPVDVRKIWASESQDFTPWLLANADRLSEALGIDLELEQAEHPVGPFKLDLVGRDLTNDAVLMVENQLEITDHNHLGQVLTYAAGTGASTVVWIATTFREEHRQALSWLNEETSSDTHFFGIELQAVRIGGSDPAPLLNVVAQPNDWQKQVKTATEAGSLSGKAQYYVDFWRKYLARIVAERPGWTQRKADVAVTTNWLDMPSPVSGSRISCSFGWSGLKHELYIDSGDPYANSELLAVLEDQKDLLEAEYGRPLQFEALEGKIACRIAEYKEGAVEVVDDHDEFVAWFIDAGDRLRRALAASTTS